MVIMVPGWGTGTLLGQGALHLEIIEGRLRDEWGVAFESGRRRVTYREAFPEGEEHQINEEWRTELHGRPISVRIGLDVRALAPEESGVVGQVGARPVSSGHRAPPFRSG